MGTHPSNVESLREGFPTIEEAYATARALDETDGTAPADP